MIQQHVVDTLADALVAEGTLVSTSTIQKALRRYNRLPGEPEGKGVSNRDLQDPLADWKKRRRYKGHLATLDLPEEMEKAIASFAELAMRIAEERSAAAHEPTKPSMEGAALLGQMERLVGRLEERLAGLAEENRALREAMAPTRSASTTPPPAIGVPSFVTTMPHVRIGRRNGVSASASRHFWTRLILELTAFIRRSGPKTATELVDVIDDETKSLAALAFDAIGVGMLVEKLKFRLERRNPTLVLKDCRYDVKRRDAPNRTRPEAQAA